MKKIWEQRKVNRRRTKSGKKLLYITLCIVAKYIHGKHDFKGSLSPKRKMSFKKTSSKGTLSANTKNWVAYYSMDRLPWRRSSSWLNGSVPDQGPLEKQLDPREAEYSVMGPTRREVCAMCTLLLRGMIKNTGQGRTTGKQVYWGQGRWVLK